MGFIFGFFLLPGKCISKTFAIPPKYLSSYILFKAGEYTQTLKEIILLYSVF